MKKIIFTIAIIGIAGVNMYRTNMYRTQLSDLQLENIEMLAEGEAYYDCDNDPNALCYHGAFPGIPKQGFIISASL